MMTFLRNLFGKRMPAAEIAALALAMGSAAPKPPRVVRCALRGTSTPRRYATFAELLADAGTLRFTPAAFLAQKAKSVSDSVFATLERFSSDGDDRCIGVSAFLEKVEAGIARESPAGDTLSTARDLDRRGTSTGALDFLGDPIKSKPLGFYTWTESLERVFRRDRFLQQKLCVEAAESIAAALSAEEPLGATYRHHLARIARLTNSLSDKIHSLLPRMACQGQETAFRTEKDEAVFPPSKTIETDFESVSEFFAKVQAGSCDLTPTPASGFYAHQLYALGPLIAPDAAPERLVRTVEAGYVEALERLAGAALFFGRETHVKQLELAPPVLAPIQPERWALPGLTIEPVPTFYARTAAAFRFLRVVVEDGWEMSRCPLRKCASRGRSLARSPTVSTKSWRCVRRRRLSPFASSKETPRGMKSRAYARSFGRSRPTPTSRRTPGAWCRSAFCRRRIPASACSYSPVGSFRSSR
jgi:hypothetical protein